MISPAGFEKYFQELTTLFPTGAQPSVATIAVTD
jgi:hypothetical protein